MNEKASRLKVKEVHPSEFVKELNFDALKGIKVAFINMPLRESATPNTPPQGPALLAARLRMYGAEPSIIDLNAYRMSDSRIPMKGNPGGTHLNDKETMALLRAHFGVHGEPDIVGLSGMITTLAWQKKVSKMVRRLFPDTFIVAGGGLGTELKDGLFRWIPELDAISHSEGDDIILRIAFDRKEVKNGRKGRVESVMNPNYFSTNSSGEHRFIYGGSRPLDLNVLPFAAWDLLHEDVYGNNILDWYIKVPVWGSAANNSSATPFSMERSLTTVSSRGCPYQCAFCYRGAQGEFKWGMRSPENLAKEVEWLIDTYGIDFVGFPDDNFAVQRKRCAPIRDAFEDIDIRWGTHFRLDEADERMEPLKESGLIYVGFGAESASENTLTRMKKGGHILKHGLTEIDGYKFPTSMVNGIKSCRDLEIHSNCTWIMGYPGETLEDLKTSVAFILWQKEVYTKGLTPGTVEHDIATDSVNQRMFTATAYPGTAMFKDPSAKALLSEHFDIKFDKTTGEPICDDALEWYVTELDDATKILTGKGGESLNFGAMPKEQFLEARSYVDNGELEKILDM